MDDADDLNAMFVGESQHGNHEDSGGYDDQRPGCPGRARLDDVQKRQAPGPDGEGHPIGRPQLAAEMPELVKGLAVSSGQSKELGKLADGNVDRQPEEQKNDPDDKDQ